MNQSFIRRLTLILSGLLAFAAADAKPLNLETAAIADLQAAFADKTLSSEQLVRAYLARIAAYDKHGPTINTVITANTKALAEAKARVLDWLTSPARAQGVRCIYWNV